MPSLSDRLKSLGVKVGAAGLTHSPKRKYPIESLLDGQLLESPYGETFVVETFYPHDHRQGSVKLTFSAPLEMISAWAHDERIASTPPEAFAYLDTETTGLATGSGTYAFLVGVARFESDGFRLAQFFLRDPAEEPALLAALNEFLAPAETLVTFNGKAFDVPLLEARYITNAAPSPLGGIAHIDMLHLARRIWSNRLPSRTLLYLEEHILGATRAEEDVPGWMIPGLYFDFIRSGDARPLKGVFYHNAMDILSMAALTSLAAHMLAEPLNEAVDHPQDLAAIGYLYEDLGLIEKAAGVMQAALDKDMSPDIQARTIKRLSILHRRQGNHDAAISLWWQAAADRSIFAHEELAKHYEHRAHDLPEALRWTQAALAIINSPETPRYEHVHWQAPLEHRLARLERKIARQESA
ncbi:MAG: ribonuclease H-like domain-containing protein [Chloroflexi bacterium]|nr:ribonuclease H-like domain-containing protein [Chloroflexota bacterium]